uniref:NADH-ubiquinone oxidoreductase chain 2 n=1 Tax=Uromastyx ornata philbyi TaxID=236745 RepID=G9M9U4_9SAUR|nr:NADH dehydrogenase subunit 2 [Uromastyx ornata philbyi]BAL41358.1 NADH dehydrogenase subunit 2 [Uromastyx ornata philbyi]BAL41359.1 NADH dehydrogenase subunit 2 [Uromastyx ornata philbyi]BAL41360.1 NADH dehydrogenase subunit 2 [Uromastyx ornata philbyi]BAL41361.1 NADH dehydrogenase subunit 2 [Uromastyx ornata philbyi]
MPPLATMTFYTGLVTSTMIVMSSHHWLAVWAGLELNTLAITPIISSPKHPRATEAATKYFLTQAVASALLLFSSTMNAWQTGQWDTTQLNNKYACTTMTIALSMKLGAAPFHFWLPEVLQGSTMQTSLLILTWQKIAPITLLYTTAHHLPPQMMLTMGILSTMVGGLGGLNQTQLRKMLAYSSISNLGWTISAMTLAPNIAMLNITIYILLSTPTLLLLSTTSTKTLKDTTSMWTTKPTASTLLTLLLLSTGGLPPFTGFLPKLLIMNELLTQNLALLGTLMAMTSLINLMYYLRIAYLTSMTTPPTIITTTMKWRLKQHQPSTLIATLTTISLLTTPMAPAITI